MEKQLECAPMIPLKEMALRRVVTHLWNDSDVLNSITNFCLDYGLRPAEKEQEWREVVEDQVKEKVSQLQLPEILLYQMMERVTPIGIQIKRWKSFHEEFFADECEEEIWLPDSIKLCFTSKGTIDCRRTGEELVRCKKLNVDKRYKLASYYCLEEYIPILWEELSEGSKEFFSKDENNFIPSLEFCWPHILKGELHKLDFLLRAPDNLSSFNQYAFELSARKGFKAATEYFFHKLTYEEREASLMRTAHLVYLDDYYYKEMLYFDVFPFLLSVMTPEQQMEMLKAHPVNVLWGFLDYPWPELYLENADLFWAVLPSSSYGDFLWKITHIYSHLLHYFPKLFQEFFLRSPSDFKKCFIRAENEDGDIPAHSLLWNLFDCLDSESVEIMFRNLDAADRLKIIFHTDVLRLFTRTFELDNEDYVEKGRMMKVCLREVALSKEDIKRLKKNFSASFAFFDADKRREGDEFLVTLYGTDDNANNEKKALKRKLEN